MFCVSENSYGLRYYFTVRVPESRNASGLPSVSPEVLPVFLSP
jgi:hypothetical protein